MCSFFNSLKSKTYKNLKFKIRELTLVKYTGFAKNITKIPKSYKLYMSHNCRL